MKLFLASSNSGKLREYLDLAHGTNVEMELLPNFADFSTFKESAPTFAENATGKALHYSRFVSDPVLADGLDRRIQRDLIAVEPKPGIAEQADQIARRDRSKQLAGFGGLAQHGEALTVQLTGFRSNRP